MPPHRVLVVDRDAARASAAAALAASADSGEPAFDQVLIDLSLPGLDLSLLRAALSAGDAAPPDALASAERRHIARVLEHTGGNRRRAAQVLGISRSTLLNKIRKYRIDLRMTP